MVIDLADELVDFEVVEELLEPSHECLQIVLSSVRRC